MTTLIFDIETNGLLRKLTKIHCLCIIDANTKEQFVFRANADGDNIAEGVEMLAAADVIVGHNSVAFDVPAIQKLFPNFMPKLSRDTLVMCRVAASDIKQHDYTLWRKDLLPGALIGSHSLEAWGYRVKSHKGDYAKEMEKKGLDPWAEWNQDMEDYCVNDTEITAILWDLVIGQGLPDTCVTLEHDMQRLAAKMEHNGFPFDKAAALKLAEEVGAAVENIRQMCVEKYGTRLVPQKKVHVSAAYTAPTSKPKQYAKPDTDWGEDYSRHWWAEITHPKINRVFNGAQYSVGAPYCKAKWQEFNVGSRPQVIDRLVDEGWVPTEFTETGAPSTEDGVLKVVGETIPIAKDIAEYYFLNKLHGQIATGNSSWLKSFDEDTGCVHPYTNIGGTVTGRAAHSSPNIAQVPAVIVGKDKKPMLGRQGEYGYECRSLFRVPEFWSEVGVDLKGIELRCLAALVSEFDGGELVEVVINGDPHQYNMDKTGIPSRDIIKRVLYGLLYGAGDVKLGITAKPTASENEARMLGASLRAQLMTGLPALKRAIDKVQKEAQRGFLIGLDGRRLKVRSQHSALNTRLQSDAALIAKKWMILTEQYAIDAGMYHGWHDGEYVGDFAMMAWVHDEVQAAVAPEYANEFADLCVTAARDAGEFFNFACPVDADPKVGRNWAECH